MLDSRHKPASGEGTPVQVRDGPAAVRGDALPPRRHWALSPGRRWEREPRVRRPAARRQPARTPRGRRIRVPPQHRCPRGPCRRARRRLPFGGSSAAEAGQAPPLPPHHLEPAANNLRQAYAEILGLGRLTGHRHGAKAVVHSMRRHLAAIVASVPTTRRHLRVYHELDPTYYSATSTTFIGSIYKLFGFRDIADAADGAGGGYPQLSGEYIVAKDPQIIVLADTRCCGQSYGNVAERP